MHLNLTWPKFSDHVKEVFQDVMTSSDFTDVTIVCDDEEQFRAHKLVLSACSPVFRRIISCLPTKDAVIFMKGVKHKEMKSILEFIYLGQSTFYEDRLDEFLKVARDLDIKEIGENGKGPIEQIDYHTHSKEKSPVKIDSGKGVLNPKSSIENLTEIDSDDITYEAENSPETIKDENIDDSREIDNEKIESNQNDNNGKKIEPGDDDPSKVSFKFIQVKEHERVLVTHDGHFKWNKNQTYASGGAYYNCSEKNRSGCKARAVLSNKTVKTEHGEEIQSRLVSISSYEVSNKNNVSNGNL